MDDNFRLGGDFWLGDVLVRPRDRQFDVAGEVRQIDHKALFVLGCLVENAGSAVAKKEIFDQVWGQDFVSDEVLTVAISRLRRALGDRARAPRFIETVPHVGYRLIAPLRPAGAARETTSPVSAAGSPPWLRARWVFVLVGVVVAGVMGVFLRPSSEAPAEVPAPMKALSSIEPAAHESYLRGRYLLGHEGLPRSAERLKNAVREFERAIALEPDFGAAHISLSEAWLALGEQVLIPPREAFPSVRTAAEQALALGQEPARAHAVLAMVLFLYEWDFAAAEHKFRWAIELDPNEILARDGYSRYLTVQGRFSEALAQQRTLRELNPLIYHQPYLAYIYNMARQHDLALAELEKQLEIERGSARLYSHLTSTWRWLGKPLEGRRSFRTYLRLSGAAPRQIEKIDAAFVHSGVPGVAGLIVEHLERVEAGGGWVSAMSHAEVRTLAGDFDAAIEQLEVAFAARDPDLLLIAQSPDYDALRRDPRFQEILRRIGLPAAREGPSPPRDTES